LIIGTIAIDNEENLRLEIIVHGQGALVVVPLFSRSDTEKATGIGEGKKRKHAGKSSGSFGHGRHCSGEFVS